MELREVLRRRRMVRSFEDRAIAPDVLERVMRSVLHAPTAGFTQGNEFLVLTAREATQRFVEITDDPRWPLDPDELAAPLPVIVLPMSNEGAYLERYSREDKAEFGMQTADAWPVPYWHLDAAMASMLILLAAIDEGLGGWFFGISYGEAELLRAFDVPSAFRPIGAIALGYPAQDEEPTGSSVKLRRRPYEEIVHVGHWQTIRDPRRAH